MTRDDHNVPPELQALARRVDAEPGWLRDAAKAVLTWRTVDSELAALTWDSLSEDAELAAVRGGDAPRLLTFEGAGATLDLQVEETRSGRRVLGQLSNPRGAELEIRHGDSSTRVELDEVGRFSAEDVPSGPVSFRIRLRDADGATVVIDTPWEPI